MLFCLKPSKQVQYLQISFKNRDKALPCASSVELWESKAQLPLLLSPLPAFTLLKWCGGGRTQELGTDD